MISMILFVTQRNTHTLISVRLVRLVIPSDAPRTPKLVADEPVPDATADESMPDTSGVPVLPNSSTYVRNPKVCWRSDVLKLPTPPRHTTDSTTLAYIHANSPRDYANTTTYHPHLETQPETPLPAPSTDDTPMPLQPNDETPLWVCQEPDTPWASREPDTPVDIPQQFVSSPPIQVLLSWEESNMSTGDAILPLSIPPPWFDDTPPPPPTTHDEILPPATNHSCTCP